MAKVDNVKKRVEQENKAYKADFLSGFTLGIQRSAVHKTVGFKQLGKFKIPVTTPHGKLGAALYLASAGLNFKSIYHGISAATHSDTPIGTFLKTQFIGGASRTVGAVGGLVSGRGMVSGSLKLKKLSSAYAAKDAVRFRRAGKVAGEVVSTKFKKPTGDFVFRRVRGRIIPIRVDRLALGKGK